MSEAPTQCVHGHVGHMRLRSGSDNRRYNVYTWWVCRLCARISDAKHRAKRKVEYANRQG